MMLLALAFVLARNVIKLLVERRRALPFARFRAKLVLALLGMTLIPAVLVLIVGSRVVLTRGRSLVQRADGGDPVVGATASPATTTRSAQRLVARSGDAARAVAEPARSRVGRRRRACANIVTPEVTGQRIGMVQVYRAVARAGRADRRRARWSTWRRRRCRRAGRAASADRLAAARRRRRVGSRACVEPMAGGGGDLMRAASAIRNRARPADRRRRGQRLPVRRSRRARRGA